MGYTQNKQLTVEFSAVDNIRVVRAYRGHYTRIRRAVMHDCAEVMHRAASTCAGIGHACSILDRASLPGCPLLIISNSSTYHLRSGGTEEFHPISFSFLSRVPVCLPGSASVLPGQSAASKWMISWSVSSVPSLARLQLQPRTAAGKIPMMYATYNGPRTCLTHLSEA